MKPSSSQISKKMPVNYGQFAILEIDINLHPEDSKQKATVAVPFGQGGFFVSLTLLE
jgi:hypothetical protein